jgi:hypothetical protein
MKREKGKKLETDAQFDGQELQPDWRVRLADESDEDDDEELEETPADVVGMLGFDPKDEEE